MFEYLSEGLEDWNPIENRWKIRGSEDEYEEDPRDEHLKRQTSEEED